jgi:hypothetical protein
MLGSKNRADRYFSSRGYGALLLAPKRVMVSEANVSGYCFGALWTN